MKLDANLVMFKSAFDKEKLLNTGAGETRLNHIATLIDVENWINDNNSDTLWMPKGDSSLFETLKKCDYICVDGSEFYIVSVLCDVCGEKLHDHISKKTEEYIRCDMKEHLKNWGIY